jgi:outer membrane protein assembly factor BamB
MKDAELLAAVDRKSPDQLSLLELEGLRSGLQESEYLRDELLERRQIREYLTEALARIDVSLDAILAQTPRRAVRARREAPVSMIVAVLLLLLAGAAYWRPWSETPASPVAEADSDKIDEKAGSGDAEKDGDPRSKAGSANASEETDEPPPPAAADQRPAPPKPAEHEAPSPPVASGPWDAALDPASPPANFYDVAFRPFDTARTTPGKEELSQWLTPTDAHASIGEKRTSVGNCGAISGVLRLAAPVRGDAALRFAVEDYEGLKIHAFRGERGVTLIFYQGMNFGWAAYHTTRQGGAPQPESFILAATDGGRNQRTEIRHGGPYELRHHEGALILSRGDVPLVIVPMDDPPDEVFFDGKAAFLGLEMVKTTAPPFPAGDNTNLAETPPPANLEWKPSLGEGAEFKKHDDGAVELIGSDAAPRSFAMAPLPGAGLREIVLELDAVSPGAAVFLGRGEEGRPFELVKFLHDKRTGKLCLALHGDDDAFEREFEPVEARMNPFVPERPRLKLLFGCGILRCWLSGDGKHWSEPLYDLRTGLPGDVTHVGLHVAGKRPDCRIVLRSIHTRPLTAVPALAEEALLREAPAWPLVESYSEWIDKVIAAQPADADAFAWRRACAVNTLAAGCTQRLGEALVDALLDDAASRLPVEEQLALLDEAALLLDLRSDRNRLLEFFGRYHRLAEEAYREGNSRPLSLVRRPIMTAPIATPHQAPLGGENLVRTELIELLNAEDWPAVLDFCELLRFYRLDENAPLGSYARALAQRAAPQSAGAGAPAEQRDAWRHPLVEELSKDAYNFLAEFRAVLESEAFEEAARMIASVEPHTAPGVAADRRDPRLLVSLPAAIRLALRDWPALATVMEEQFADLAELRVRRALSQGDEAAVRSAALQFDATPAASLAARWLGDRALSRGHFEQALSLYDRAQRTADVALEHELAPRKRLAGAMLGRDLGSSVSSTVELGDVQIAANEFESLVAAMRERAADSPETFIHGAAAAPRIQAPPAATGFTAHVRGRLDGPAGEKPNEIPRHVREQNVDWAARQLAWVVEGDAIYVSNRFHVAAYELSGGKRKWQSPAPPGRAARAHEWSLAPMRPLVTEKHVLVRQLNADGPLLTCLDKQDGKVIWTSQPPQGEWLASDPLAVQGRLLALRLRRDSSREMSLLLCDYDSATGEPLDQQELLRLREASWTGRFVCQAAVVDDAVVAVLGGCAVCVDLTGGVRWIRRQLYLPPEEDLSWGGQHHEPPLVEDGRLFLAQPGVRAVECIDADTGRSVWTRVLPDVRRLVGSAAGRLIVETADGFLALHADSGETMWRHVAGDRLEGRFCDENHLVYVRQDRQRDDEALRPELVWADAATGEPRATAVLDELARKELTFGPMIAHQDRIWSFAGSGPQDPNRDIVELVPGGEAERLAASPEDVWLEHVDASIRQAAAGVLPEWRVLRGIFEKHSGFHAEQFGEGEVFSLDGTAGEPVVFARRVTIPQSGRARLRLRLAMAPLRPGQLHVEFRGEGIWEQKLDDQTLGAQTWRDFEADLSSRAGQSGWLVVRFVPEKNERYTSFWKRLELAF